MICDGCGEAVGVNRAAVERTIAALSGLGHFEECDAAVLQMLRSLAAAVDDKPGNANLWKQYREALEGLRSDGDDDKSKAAEALIEFLSSPVRDT